MQLYDFSGPEHGGFILFNLKEYESHNREEQLNFIRFYTHDSVISFFRLFYKTLREKIIAENPELEEDEILRQMAHSDLGGGIRHIDKVGNFNDLIGFIEKIGMYKEDAVYDVEKYLDIQEIGYGKIIKGYND